MAKYKKEILQARIDNDEQERMEQEQLKKKHRIKDKNVVVVEKSNTFKFIVNMSVRLIKTVAAVAVISLAAIGLIGLAYEAPRADLIEILQSVAGNFMK